MPKDEFNEELELVEMPIIRDIKLTDVGVAYVSEDSKFIDVRYLVIYTNGGDKFLFALTPKLAEKLGKQI